MNATPNLFDPATRQQLRDLYGAKPKPTREEWLAQLKAWGEMADKTYTSEELAAARAALQEADSAQPELTLRHSE